MYIHIYTYTFNLEKRRIKSWVPHPLLLLHLPVPPDAQGAGGVMCGGGWWVWVVFPGCPLPSSLSLWHGCFLDESGSCLGLHFKKKASLQTRERELKRKSKKRWDAEPKIQHFGTVTSQFWALFLFMRGWWWWSLVTTRTPCLLLSCMFCMFISWSTCGCYVSSFSKIKVTPLPKGKVCPFYFL